MADESDKLVYHPTVLAAVRAVLRSRGLAGADLEDAVHNVVEKLLKVKGENRPVDVEAWTRLGRKVANDEGVSQYRHGVVEGNIIAGPIDDADSEVPLGHVDLDRRLDAAKTLEAIDEITKEEKFPQHTREILEGVAEGKNLKEIAKDLDRSHHRMRDARSQIMKRLDAALSARGLGAATVAVAILLIVVLGVRLLPFKEPDVAHDPQKPRDAGASPIPSSPPEQVTVDVTEKRRLFESLLADSAVLEKNEEWRRCVKSLDAAAALSLPDAGPLDPAIEARRRHCETMYAAALNSKGGSLKQQAPKTAPSGADVRPPR